MADGYSLSLRISSPPVTTHCRRTTQDRRSASVLTEKNMRTCGTADWNKLDNDGRERISITEAISLPRLRQWDQRQAAACVSGSGPRQAGREAELITRDLSSASPLYLSCPVPSVSLPNQQIEKKKSLVYKTIFALETKDRMVKTVQAKKTYLRLEKEDRKHQLEFFSRLLDLCS